MATTEIPKLVFVDYHLLSPPTPNLTLTQLAGQHSAGTDVKSPG